jgi:hypothetical protein
MIHTGVHPIMATCPYCYRILDDQHRCFGVWRVWARRIGVAVVGGVVGILVPFLFPGYKGTWIADSIAGLLGAFVASVTCAGLRLVNRTW